MMLGIEGDRIAEMARFFLLALAVVAPLTWLWVRRSHKQRKAEALAAMPKKEQEKWLAPRYILSNDGGKELAADSASTSSHHSAACVLSSFFNHLLRMDSFQETAFKDDLYNRFFCNEFSKREFEEMVETRTSPATESKPEELYINVLYVDRPAFMRFCRSQPFKSALLQFMEDSATKVHQSIANSMLHKAISSFTGVFRNAEASFGMDHVLEVLSHCDQFELPFSVTEYRHAQQSVLNLLEISSLVPEAPALCTETFSQM